MLFPEKNYFKKHTKLGKLDCRFCFRVNDTVLCPTSAAWECLCNHSFSSSHQKCGLCFCCTLLIGRSALKTHLLNTAAVYYVGGVGCSEIWKDLHSLPKWPIATLLFSLSGFGAAALLFAHWLSQQVWLQISKVIVSHWSSGWCWRQLLSVLM